MDERGARTFQLALADGRRLDARVSGPEGATPVVFLHGTPGSRLPFRVLERRVHERGLRLVTTSRPGYGSSSRLEGRAVADVVGDVAAVLDELGAERCAVAGWSGGGPHALACAARLPQARAALVVAGVAPYAEAPDLDWLAGMAEENVAEYGAALEGADAVRPFLEAARELLGAATAAEVAEALGGLLPEPDRRALHGHVADDLAANVHEAVASGLEGWLDDDLSFVTPWGFDLAEVAVPVSLWQGDADLMVPPAHGEWLADHVPGIRVHALGGEGHISLVVAHAAAMLGELAALLAPAS